MEVEEGEDQDEEEDGAVDAGSLEPVCSGQEEEDVDWRRICAKMNISIEHGMLESRSLTGR